MTETIAMRLAARMRAALLLGCALLLSACGNDAPKPAKLIETPQEAVTRIGDVTIRANVLRTASLDETVARGYDIQRSENTVLLLVAVRKGPDGQDTALPATVQASVVNLQGQRRDIAMRELHTGGPASGAGQALIDYVGIVDVSPPDTLSFDLKIVREGGATSLMQFSRDFAPL
jgi:hypothetical protein